MLMLSPMEGACSPALPTESAAHVMRGASFTHCPERAISWRKVKVAYKTSVRLAARLTEWRPGFESHCKSRLLELALRQVPSETVMSALKPFCTDSLASSGCLLLCDDFLRSYLWTANPPAIGFLARKHMILCQSEKS